MWAANLGLTFIIHIAILIPTLLWAQTSIHRDPKVTADTPRLSALPESQRTKEELIRLNGVKKPLPFEADSKSADCVLWNQEKGDYEHVRVSCPFIPIGVPNCSTSDIDPKDEEAFKKNLRKRGRSI